MTNEQKRRNFSERQSRANCRFQRPFGVQIHVQLGTGKRSRIRHYSDVAAALDLWRLASSRWPEFAYFDLVLDEAALMIIDILNGNTRD